ncbi:MAG TPA: hypothetical protein VMZ71_16165, partial [Gemmataceae bacterium]|nr:hypothetical protein [Gemmataceae bacterium]
MFRQLTSVGFVVLSLGSSGCAGTWDTLTSRRFRNEPFTTMGKMVNPEDPMVVLRNPHRDGDERAKAMRRLKEPLGANGTQQDQDEMIDLLGRTATADASPVLRLAAIEALGRFDDPRAANALMYAYQNAHGRADNTPAPAPEIQQAGAGGRRAPVERFALTTGPTGFSPDTVAVIRCRSLESLGKTNKPDAAKFLAAVATEPPPAQESADEREVRLAAVRGLSKCRQPESVVALAHVLSKEVGKDAAVVGRAHDGLVSLTGKKLPPDPQQWSQVVQA